MIPISLFLYPPPPHHFFHSCIPFCSLFRTQSFFHLWSNLNISISQNSFSIVFPISHVFSRPNSQDQTEIRCDYLIIPMVDKPYCHHLARKCNARNIQSFTRQSAPPSGSFSPFYILVSVVWADSLYLFLSLFPSILFSDIFYTGQGFLTRTSNLGLVFFFLILTRHCDQSKFFAIFFRSDDPCCTYQSQFSRYIYLKPWHEHYTLIYLIYRSWLFSNCSPTTWPKSHSE